MPLDDGRPRYSPSQINLFLDEPALWLIRRRFKIKSEAGPKAWLGTAVQAGVERMFFPALNGEDDTLALAEHTFDVEGAGETNEDIAAQRARIPAMLKLACDAMRPLGKPLTVDGRCEMQIGAAVVMGYTDFDYPDQTIDLKTGTRIPSKPTPAQMIQMAVYGAARSKPQRLLYVSDKRAAFYPAADQPGMTAELDYWLATARRAIEAMLRVDAMSDADAMRLFPPRDLDFYLWDDKARAKAREIWRLP